VARGTAQPEFTRYGENAASAALANLFTRTAGWYLFRADIFIGLSRRILCPVTTAGLSPAQTLPVMDNDLTALRARTGDCFPPSDNVGPSLGLK
jgi:hypothetical protein